MPLPMQSPQDDSERCVSFLQALPMHLAPATDNLLLLDKSSRSRLANFDMALMDKVDSNVQPRTFRFLSCNCIAKRCDQWCVRHKVKSLFEPTVAEQGEAPSACRPSSPNARSTPSESMERPEQLSVSSAEQPLATHRRPTSDTLLRLVRTRDVKCGQPSPRCLAPAFVIFVQLVRFTCRSCFAQLANQHRPVSEINSQPCRSRACRDRQPWPICSLKVFDYAC